jgi:predicted RNase H-like nuclease (RuvC/YqgF family)
VRSHPRSLLLAAVVAVGLSACAQQDDEQVEELRAELVARTEAESALTERLDALEEELAALGADVSTVTRLDELEDHLTRVESSLTVLDDQVADEAAARRSATEDAEAAASDLRSTLASLQEAVDALRGETDELRVLYETLRDRLDRQQRG